MIPTNHNFVPELLLGLDDIRRDSPEAVNDCIRLSLEYFGDAGSPHNTRGAAVRLFARLHCHRVSAIISIARRLLTFAGAAPLKKKDALDSITIRANHLLHPMSSVDIGGMEITDDDCEFLGNRAEECEMERWAPRVPPPTKGKSPANSLHGALESAAADIRGTHQPWYAHSATRTRIANIESDHRPYLPGPGWAFSEVLVLTETLRQFIAFRKAERDSRVISSVFRR